MKENIDKIKKEKERIDKRIPYSYEEYCRRFKTLKKDNRKIFKRELLLIFLIAISILVYFLVSDKKEVPNKANKDILIVNEEEKTPVLKEVWDKGIKLELNEVKLDGNNLNIKMTLDYKNLDKALIDENEKSMEYHLMFILVMIQK